MAPVLLPTSSQSNILQIIILIDYGSIALYIWVGCVVPMELSSGLPASGLVVHISLATQEIHHGTCIASYVVDYDDPESHQENEVLPLLEDPFLYTKHLGEVARGF